MKIEIIKNGLIIVPETNFEAEYITQFQLSKNECFVKTGTTLNDIVGLKIVKKEKVDGDNRK